MNKNNQNSNLIEDYESDALLEEDFHSDIPQSIVIDFGTYQYEAIQSVISTVTELCRENKQLHEQINILGTFIEESGLPVPGGSVADYGDDSIPDFATDDDDDFAPDDSIPDFATDDDDSPFN